MAPGMEARCMPVRMASVSAASLFSAALAADPSAVVDGAGLVLLHPASSAAAAVRPNTTAHRRRARCRCGAAGDRPGVSGWLPGARFMSWALLRVDASERFPDAGVRYAANER